MADDWTDVLTLTDATGKRITVSHARGYVRAAVRSPAGIVLASIVLDAGERDQFMKAFAEAERQAEAHDATADDFAADPHHDPGVAWAAGDDTAYGRTPEDNQ